MAFTAHAQCSDPGVSVFAPGERQEASGNIIFELFSKMTALGPSEVFISGAFKDFELEQTRFFFSPCQHTPFFLPR